MNSTVLKDTLSTIRSRADLATPTTSFSAWEKAFVKHMHTGSRKANCSKGRSTYSCMRARTMAAANFSAGSSSPIWRTIAKARW